MYNRKNIYTIYAFRAAFRVWFTNVYFCMNYDWLWLWWIMITIAIILILTVVSIVYYGLEKCQVVQWNGSGEKEALHLWEDKNRHFKSSFKLMIHHLVLEFIYMKFRKSYWNQVHETVLSATWFFFGLHGREWGTQPCKFWICIQLHSQFVSDILICNPDIADFHSWVRIR